MKKSLPHLFKYILLNTFYDKSTLLALSVFLCFCNGVFAGNFTGHKKSFDGLVVSAKVAAPPTITASSATGTIVACAGTASASPNIQQFTVSGSGLAANITVTAPTGFEISLAPGSGYGSSVTLSQSGGIVNSTVLYVRSAASATAGNILGHIVLTTTGATSKNVFVTGTVNALPTVTSVSNQALPNGSSTTSVSFTSTTGAVNWINNNPGIGLAAHGTGNIDSFTAINTGNSPVTATITATPVSADFAYITNSGSNTISVINTATNTITATITVGTHPFAIAVGGVNRVYVANIGSNNVSVINTVTNKVVATTSVGNSPAGIAVTPDGSRVYVANSGTDYVSVINAITNRVISVIHVGLNPNGLAVSPDGSRVFVANNSSNNVSVISTATGSLIGNIDLGITPANITFSPDGSLAYVTVANSNTVSVINATTYGVIRTIDVGGFPIGITITPDGQRLYVANYNEGTVSVINTQTNEIMAVIPVGSAPIGISVNPEGSRVYVTNQQSNSVSVINTVTNAVVATIATTSNPGSGGNFISAGAGCSGAPVTFTITVNPTISHDAGLSNLTISDGVLNPSFDVGKTTYTDTVTDAVTSVQVRPTTSYPSASVTVNGNAVPSGSLSAGIPLSVGSNTITTTVTAQDGTTTKTYTLNIVVIQRLPTIMAGLAMGNISACKGTASASPNIQQFTVSGSILTGDITAMAPSGFEVSLAPGSGYSGSVVLAQSAGAVNIQTIYVRSAASASGNISGNITLTAAGAVSKTVAVNGILNDVLKVNPISNQTISNGASTSVNFSGTALLVNWTNDTPGIGLAASGAGNIPSFIGLNHGSSPVTATITAVPVSVPLAYITNSGSNTVSVINTFTNTIVATVTVGLHPFAIAVGPGARVYVANYGDNTVSVINTLTNIVMATIPVGEFPSGIAVNPDGSRVYVANANSNTVSVINTSTNAVTSSIPVDSNPYGVAVSPDGSRLYVTNGTSNNVSIINTTINAVISTMDVGTSPCMIALTPNGSRMYVANANSGTISVINTANNNVSTINVGLFPIALTVTPDGKRVYVANYSDGSVSVINTQTNTVIATIGVGSAPIGISANPNGNSVYVTNQQSKTVSVISTASNNSIGTITVPSTPGSVGNFISGGTGCNVTPVTFTITVNPGTPLNAALSDVSISNGTLTPSFTAGTTSYSDTVSNATASISITPATNIAGATITVNGNTVASGAASASIPLSISTNAIPIVVTAPNGTTKTYNIKVTRLSNNANLANLVISSGTLSPVFAASKTSYADTVLHTTTSVQITAIAANPTATIKVNGSVVSSGKPSIIIPLSITTNTVTVTLTAQDGTTKTYIVKIIRLSNNANLSNLTISSGTLTPTFAVQTNSYTVSVSNATTSIQITPTVQNPAATVTINGLNIQSGTPSASQPLVIGVNTIYTIVTAQDGTTRGYIITVTRSMSGLNSLYQPGSTEQTPLILSLDDRVQANNLLTPNGDGFNDTWVVKNIAFYPNNTVTVYDFTGNVVFTRKGYNNDWAGTYRGAALHEGVYYYRIDLGNGKQLKGDITVISR